MAGIKKLIQKKKDQPHGIMLEEADRVLRHNRYHCKRQKGSHCQYINSTGNVITVLAESPVKKAYIAGHP
jgi:predicted RNA binding protein YcfA (HicA-like mRNA interferase family)